MNKKTDLTGTSKGYKIFSVIILVAMVLFLSLIHISEPTRRS